MNYYEEPAKKLPVKEFDVVVAGGGTAGVVAAIAAARRGAKTALIEAKGYVGGIVVEGGTALHSYFNLWKAFPGVEKRQLVKGIPSEIIERLEEKGATSGHVEMLKRYEYDSVNTGIDTELYKLVVLEMLEEAGAELYLNTLLAGAIVEDGTIKGVITESRAGREVFLAKAFVDTTGYGDLSAYAGAKFTEPNDHDVANSIGVGGVDVDAYYRFFEEKGALLEYADGVRSGKENQHIRIRGDLKKACPEFEAEARKIGFSTVTTTLYDNYLMFLKLNYHMPASPTNRDAATKAEIALRKRQYKAIELIRKYIPGCEHAFIARTSPSLCIRRARCIECDYDITLEDITEARHFEDDIMAYGFHDNSPKYQVKNGGSYGIPYRALCPVGLGNLLVAGMLITSAYSAHMSTRNTVSCMGQGQAAGTAAALCAERGLGIRELSYPLLREALLEDGVHLEN